MRDHECESKRVNESQKDLTGVNKRPRESVRDHESR